MSPKTQTALAVYSAILSSFVAIAVWNNAAKQGRTSEPHTITTQRINIGEPKRNSSNGDLKSHPTSRRDRRDFQPGPTGHRPRRYDLLKR